MLIQSSQAITLRGNLRTADYSNTSNITNSDIALISCDANGGNIPPSSVVAAAGDAKPVAIVLYSVTSQSCNLTSEYTFATMYTMTSQAASSALLVTAGLYPQSASLLTAMISANQTTGTLEGGSPSSTANNGGPAPTTAVAMSILYSITGIIT